MLPEYNTAVNSGTIASQNMVYNGHSREIELLGVSPRLSPGVFCCRLEATQGVTPWNRLEICSFELIRLRSQTQ